MCALIEGIKKVRRIENCIFPLFWEEKINERNIIPLLYKKLLLFLFL